MTTAGVAGAQPVISYTGTENLQARFEWAAGQAATQSLSSYWFGYAVVRTVSENSFMGRWRNSGKTLDQILSSGNGDLPRSDYVAEARKAVDRIDGRKSDRMVERPVAVLLQFAGPGKRLVEVQVADMNSMVDLEGQYLLWGGTVNANESVSVVASMMSESPASLREDLVSAIGVLDESDSSFDALVVSLRDESPEVRQNALFWLGRQDTDRAFDVVVSSLKSEASSDNREHAVFVLSRFDRKEATDELIRIARSDSDEDVAQAARFWLGRQIVSSLYHEYDKDESLGRVQRQALYALVGADDGNEVSFLKDLASNGKSESVRREALLMLSRSEERGALDALLTFYHR